MAIVVDEYGGTAGIVTWKTSSKRSPANCDEYDQARNSCIKWSARTEYSFIGRIDLEDVNELLGTHLAKEAAETLGGYIYGEIGRVPTGGEELEIDDWVLTVEQISGRRIRMVRARRKQVDQPQEETIHDANQREQTKPD
jgi:Mg2+/Co2+ transporter CorC